jgi:hypothetical protein
LKQSEQSLPPWARGPFELIRHATEHLKMDGDTDRRIALIGFDNAIEACIDVFQSLHPKVHEGIEISSADVEKARKNYHPKLEFFYEFVDERCNLVSSVTQPVIPFWEWLNSR